MVNQLTSAGYSRSVCEVRGEGQRNECQADQGGQKGKMTPQRVLVLWRNTEGGQGRQQGERKGRRQQEEREGRQGGEEKGGGKTRVHP